MAILGRDKVERRANYFSVNVVTHRKDVNANMNRQKVKNRHPPPFWWSLFEFFYI